MRKKILIFNKGYYPGIKFGGPVTSLYNFAKWLSKEYEIKIVTLNHDYKERGVYKTISKGWNKHDGIDVLYMDDKECYYEFFEYLIKLEKPSLVYLSGTITSFFGYNKYVICICNKEKIPVIDVPRGDICGNALKIKWYKKIPVIAYLRISKNFKKIFFQTTLEEETRNLLKYFHVDKKRIYQIPNFPSALPLASSQNKKLKKTQGVLRLVFCSRIQSKKNLLTALLAVNKCTCRVIFDIYGPIEQIEYWDLCKKEIQHAPDNVTITYCGALNPEEAKFIYNRYDAFIFPTKSENYGHVIVESLQCGCPVILSRKTTPWDDINGVAGVTVDLGNIAGFTKSIDKLAEMDDDQYNILVSNSIKYIDSHTDINILIEQYTAMIRACILAVAKK